MKCAVPIISRDQAWRKLHRRRLSSVFLARTSPDSSSSSEKQEHLELVYLPSYLVEIGSQRLAVQALVDAFEGHAVLVDLSSAAWREETTPFVPTLSFQRADELARDLLARLRPLRRRGAVNAPCSRIELIGYPYWAYYYQRRAGKLDAKLLDALTGAAAGPRMKIALLAALASVKSNPR
jgi:hypothetical protein